MVHPNSRPGAFQPELWKFDVAEFFLRSPKTGRYLEFNLSPNGSWWSCLFDEPLVAVAEDNPPLPGVVATGQLGPNGWQARARLPLTWLRDHLHFGPTSTLNATFILNSPDQNFLTAGPPASGNPNFHRPDHFPPIRITSRA